MIERFERQVEALKRLAALEALLAAQAIDIVGDEPKGVAGLIYEQVRKCSPFYSKDRPLSAEVECIEELICSDAIVAQIINRAPINSFDGFFALGTAPEGTPEATRAKVVAAVISFEED
ncbi:Histidine ammonia-lyase [compost metagenome]